MSILNNPNCAEQTGNVGTPSCAIGITYPVGFILTEDSFKITAAQMTSWATTLAALSAACLAPVGQRIYPMFNVIGLTDNTPAPEAKTSGYGIITKHIEKPHSFELDTRDLGSKFHAELRKFKNRKDLRIYWVDAEGFIGGEENADGDLLGFKCTFQPKQIKVGNVADVSKYMVQVDLTDPTCLTDKLSAIEFADTVNLDTELNGVLNVDLVECTGLASNATFQVISSISKTNLYDEYKAELVELSSYVFTNAATGATIVPTGITSSDSNKTIIVNIATSVLLRIRLKDPVYLASIGVGGNGTSGFESGYVDIQITV
jgi:hypothetical protein